MSIATRKRTLIYKTLHRKLKGEQLEKLHKKTGGEFSCPGMLAVLAPLATPVVLLLNDTNIP
jgi:hypothetical protein